MIKKLLKALKGQKEALIIRYEDLIQVLDEQNREIYRTKKVEKLKEILKLGEVIKKAKNIHGDEYYYIRLK
jgi:hypothetical protein